MIIPYWITIFKYYSNYMVLQRIPCSQLIKVCSENAPINLWKRYFSELSKRPVFKIVLKMLILDCVNVTIKLRKCYFSECSKGQFKIKMLLLRTFKLSSFLKNVLKMFILVYVNVRENTKGSMFNFIILQTLWVFSEPSELSSK